MAVKLIGYTYLIAADLKHYAIQKRSIHDRGQLVGQANGRLLLFRSTLKLRRDYRGKMEQPCTT